MSGMLKKALAVLTAMLLALSMIACGQPSAGTESGTTGAVVEETTKAPEQDPVADAEMGTVPYVNNDTVVLGEYEVYNPEGDIVVDGGEAIEGNEEEELQQERIAGGAVGEVVSENLEPLNGIVDYSEGEYVPNYGVEQ